jgi:hemerythrin superfamily protein
MADTRIRMPKATDLLQEDHREVRRLLQEYERQEDDAVEARTELFERILREWTIHTRVEEEIFYPACADAEEEEAGDRVEEAQEDHRAVETLLDEMTELGPEEEAFDLKMGALREQMERHIEREEREVFPLFRALDEDLRDEISERLRDRKRELESE